jgi:hypothetical protein
MNSIINFLLGFPIYILKKFLFTVLYAVYSLLLWKVKREFFRVYSYASTAIKVLKWILWWLSGKSELQRYFEDFPKTKPLGDKSITETARLTLGFEEIVMDSSELRTIYKSSIVGCQNLKRANDIPLKIAKIKRIPSKPKALRQKLELCVHKLCLKYAIINRIKKWLQSPTTGTEGSNLLDKLWRQLKNSPTPSVPHDDWKEIGFQGNDPHSDFRAMGLFGLHQLVNFTTIPSHQTIYQDAQYGDHWYSFAIVGINFSDFLYRSLKSGKFDVLIYVDSPETIEEGLKRVDGWYAQLFKIFHARWVREKAENLFAFNEIFEKTKRELGQIYHLDL